MNKDIESLDAEERQSFADYTKASFRAILGDGQQSSNSVDFTPTSYTSPSKILSKRFGFGEAGPRHKKEDDKKEEGDTPEDDPNGDNTEDTPLTDDHAAFDFEHEIDPYLAHGDDMGVRH